MSSFTEKAMIYEQRKANKTTVWLLFLFLGWSYGSFGRIGIQILYYLTLGGLGIWTFIQLFTLNGMINKHNKKIAIELGFTADELLKLGL